VSQPANEWVEESRTKLFDALSSESNNQFRPVDLNRIEHYSTFFAEWKQEGSDIMIHLFPRAGAQDLWKDGHYIPRCKVCDRERDMKDLVGTERRACQCGSHALIYIPGRVEDRPDIEFPEDMEARIETALSSTWMGDYWVDTVEELHAYYLHVLDAFSTDQQTFELLTKFFDSLDTELERA
jgi:hypothetical protein